MDEQELSSLSTLCFVPVSVWNEGLISFEGKFYRTCIMNKGKSIIFVKEVTINDNTIDEETFEGEITCPVCGYVDHDSWEAGDSDDEYECVCGAILSYSRSVSVDYSTKVVKMPIVVEIKGE